jgi:hypothetical protein
VLVVEADALVILSAASGRHMKMIPADNITDCHEFGTDALAVSEAASEISKHCFVRFKSAEARAHAKRRITELRSDAASRLSQYVLDMGVGAPTPGRKASIARRPTPSDRGTLIDVKSVGTLRVNVNNDEQEIRRQTQEEILSGALDATVESMSIRVSGGEGAVEPASIIKIHDGTIVKRYEPTSVVWCGLYDSEATDACLPMGVAHSDGGILGRTMLVGLAHVDPFFEVTWVDVLACDSSDAVRLVDLVATVTHLKRDLTSVLSPQGSARPVDPQFRGCQIDRSQFTPERVLGTGNFGTVFLASSNTDYLADGRATPRDDDGLFVYAAKILKDSASQRFWQVSACHQPLFEQL